ncbi:MAG: VF530 family protein [Burkholderiaceae bacterium]|nr:VF530 family protein [Burkholderiaceae bacterium]
MVSATQAVISAQRDQAAPVQGKSPPSDKPVPAPQARNPLHGVTLEAILTALVAHYGWDDLGQRIHIRSFVLDPSIASSLKFLRKTPWAREKVESLYLFMLREQKRPVQQRRSDSPL